MSRLDSIFALLIISVILISLYGLLISGFKAENQIIKQCEGLYDIWEG